MGAPQVLRAADIDPWIVEVEYPDMTFSLEQLLEQICDRKVLIRRDVAQDRRLKDIDASIDQIAHARLFFDPEQTAVAMRNQPIGKLDLMRTGANRGDAAASSG